MIKKYIALFPFPAYRCGVLLCPVFLFCFLGKMDAQTTGNLTVRFENMESGKGYVRVALYRNPDDFLDDEKAELFSFKADSAGTLVAEIESLSVGTYAFASFHDEDNDAELKTNFFGIPKEPYCFSRQDLSKWRPPTFEEASFEIRPGKNELTVSMMRWEF